MEIQLKSTDIPEAEYIQGCILNPLTIKVLENDLSSLATRLINLSYDPNKPMDYMQEQAALKGEINNLTYLIERSTLMADQLKSELQGN